MSDDGVNVASGHTCHKFAAYRADSSDSSGSEARGVWTVDTVFLGNVSSHISGCYVSDEWARTCALELEAANAKMEGKTTSRAETRLVRQVDDVLATPEIGLLDGHHLLLQLQLIHAAAGALPRAPARARRQQVQLDV